MRLIFVVVCGVDIAGVGMYVTLTGDLVLVGGLLTIGGSLYLICGELNYVGYSLQFIPILTTIGPL